MGSVVARGAAWAGEGGADLLPLPLRSGCGNKDPAACPRPRPSPEHGPGKGVGTLWRAGTWYGAEAWGTWALPLQCRYRPLPPPPVRTWQFSPGIRASVGGSARWVGRGGWDAPPSVAGGSGAGVQLLGRCASVKDRSLPQGHLSLNPCTMGQKAGKVGFEAFFGEGLSSPPLRCTQMLAAPRTTGFFPKIWRCCSPLWWWWWTRSGGWGDLSVPAGAL